MRRSAFSLIELLAVIAIIGLLAALLLAGVSQAKATSLRIKCGNNVRQIGLALNTFVTENGFYPLSAGSPQGAWSTVLQSTAFVIPGSTNRVPFSKWSGEGVWKCPSAIRPLDYPQHEGYLSYGYNHAGMRAKTDTNYYGLGGHFGWPPVQPVAESEVIRPDDMIAIGDSFVGNDGIIRDGGWGIGRSIGMGDYLDSTKRSNLRHRGKANIVFCDGHLESPTLKSLFEDQSDFALARWNRDDQPHRERLGP